MPRVRLICGLLAMVVSACGGDRTGATGELGRINYSLYTTYDVREASLVDARIVTGHEQTIYATLTSKGIADLRDGVSLEHTIEPSDGATLETIVDEAPVPDFNVLVREPGEYTLKTLRGEDGEEEFDRLTLTFAEPTSFEVLTKVREPWAEDFREASTDGTIDVEEGTQVVMQPIPVDADDTRLAGDLTTDFSVNKEWAAIPGQNILSAFEENVWTIAGEANFYFVEPDDSVVFTIEDPVSTASTQKTFKVTPISGAPE